MHSAFAYRSEIEPQNVHLLFMMKAPPVGPATVAIRPSALNMTAELRDPTALVNQTPLEERANTWSAAFGLAGALGFALALLWHGGTAGQWTFAASLFLLFLFSTAYHGLVAERAKEIARTLDHAAIFVLIAGTYTPFALGPLHTHGGTLLFGMEWLLALVGLGFVLCGGHDSTQVSNALYLGMGWFGLFFVWAFIDNVAPIGNGLLLAGGVFYTAGVAFYSASRWPYFHFIWHLFVLAGAICHAVAVYLYAH